MPEFLKLLPPAEALKRFIETVTALTGTETVPTAESLGRVVGETYNAPHDLPAFARTTVDGYAICARDTHGASESLPAYLKLVGEVPMGAAPDFAIQGMIGTRFIAYDLRIKSYVLNNSF